MAQQDYDVEQVIRQARQGEPGVLDRLLESYRHYLRMLARIGIDTSLRGKADPSDLAQETLIKAHLNFEQFLGQTEAELVAWLRQILVHNRSDLVRRYCRADSRNVAREFSLDELVGRSTQAADQLLAGNQNSPSASAERRELSVVLADVLAQLSDDHREVIVLHHLEDLGWDEIAQRMGRTRGAVRALWMRALRHLRPLIEPHL